MCYMLVGRYCGGVVASKMVLNEGSDVYTDLEVSTEIRSE
jgi:hypothetical protein